MGLGMRSCRWYESVLVEAVEDIHRNYRCANFLLAVESFGQVQMASMAGDCEKRCDGVFVESRYCLSLAIIYVLFYVFGFADGF